MSADETARTASRSVLAVRAMAVRDQVRNAAAAHNRDDLVSVLDGIPDIDADRPVRVIVAGSLKRGKSTLVNTLVGRPLLSPVGIDVTTACWVEIGYGEDRATALIASAESPGQPIRQPIDITEVERYVALDCVAEPVLGVEVRVRSALLRDLMLVDTPGVGGLDTGHSQVTLTALRQADALLFVSDCTQPILAPEVDFLAQAAERVATVVIAVTKSDIPGCDVVVRETCERIAGRRELASIPVFAVSPPLADQAHGIDNETLATRLTELSGIAPLVAALRRRTAIGRDALRIANCAHATASVAQALARELRDRAADPLGVHGRTRRLEADEVQLAAAVADHSVLSVAVAGYLMQLRTQPRESFAAATGALRLQYQDEAQRGPAAQLATLAARMAADLTAVGVAALDIARSLAEQLTRAVLERVGASEIATDLLAGKQDGIDLGLVLSEPGEKTLPRGFAVAGELFPTLIKLIAGSAAVVSVLTGPGAVAASLAIAACAGWWRARSGAEQERRSQLRGWVSSAADQATAAFGDEMARRINTVQEYLNSALPALVEARRADLARVRHELAEFRAADAEAQRLAQTRLLIATDRLRALADEAADIARTVSYGKQSGVGQ
jgi:Dynamin family